MSNSEETPLSPAQHPSSRTSSRRSSGVLFLPDTDAVERVRPSLTRHFTRSLSLQGSTLSASHALKVLRSKNTTLDFGDGEERVVLGQRIADMGFGLYQVHVFVLCSGFVMVECAQIAIAAGLVDSMSAEFGVTGMGKAMLTTATFLGFAIGTFLAGPLADSMGRRVPISVGYLGVVISTGVTCLCTQITTLVVCRCLLGIFTGIGLPISVVAMMEVSAPTHRGPIMAMLAVLGVIGELWVGLGLCLFMPDLLHGSWRGLLAWAGLPAMLYLLFGLLSPVTRHDTPFWLASCERQSELIQVLNLIATFNDKQELNLADSEEVDHDAAHNLSFGEEMQLLSSSPRRQQCMVMAVLCFTKDFVFFGTNIFWPQLWAAAPGVVTLAPAAKLLVTSMLGGPGCFLAFVLMWQLPRRIALASSACLCGAAAVLIPFIASGSSIGYLSIGLFKLFFPTWQACTCLLPSEIFGTEIRGLATGTASFAGRLATILAPVMVELGEQTFIPCLVILSFLTAGAVLPLPETKDCELVNEVYSKDDTEEGGTYGATLPPVPEKFERWLSPSQNA